MLPRCIIHTSAYTAILLSGVPFPGAPAIAIGFQNGRVQLSSPEFDFSASLSVVINTGLTTLCAARWSSNGTVLAVGGIRMTNGRETSEVLFYSPFGRLLTSLRVPGGTLNALSWEGGGLRIAVRVMARRGIQCHRVLW